MKKKNLRSKQWFDDPKDPGMTAMYLERYLNYGLTRKELQSGNPIIGIAQSGSDLSPCNRHFLDLSKRIKDGIRRAGGIPMEFPTHPIQETGKKPLQCWTETYHIYLWLKYFMDTHLMELYLQLDVIKLPQQR